MNEIEIENYSVLPLVIENDFGQVTEITLCNSIAGGANEVSEMPAELSLMRFRNGELVGHARYKFERLIGIEDGLINHAGGE